ncbi:DUF368 domain-containing protein [Paraferrimonas sp. SM1919]|uniref:DUF368 domain-containing protein n=1 Tax=Paraferrimonas sp. SM1919 TaxID=2662263 RepID=UPI0013D6E37D|nr:DUF368 domain-containing protein [Paraferrimonas sp. SM1919]
MGAADVVPGVSGGTIAFITGIYETLLESIRRINPTLIIRLKNEGIKGSWEYINGTFLVVLFAGILTSIATLAKVISFLLVEHPVPLWSFFFGLIIVSVWHMLRQVQSWQVSRILALVLGGLFAYGITEVTPVSLDVNYVTVFFGGAIAICAMILPGISGSFILLLLGLYSGILGAVKSFDIGIISVFMLGCITGLLSFSHILSMLLKRAKDIMLVFLTGLMIGTLPKIWPWKQTITWRTNSKGEQVPLLQENLSPETYEQLLNLPAQLPMALALMAVAISIVLALEYFGKDQG